MKPPASTWERSFAALAIAAIVVSGCDWLPLDWNRVGFRVTNHSEVSLDIYYIYDSQEQKYVTGLGPGQTVIIDGLLSRADDCRGPLVARDSSGAEVARRTEPICNHEEWIIGTPPP